MNDVCCCSSLQVNSGRRGINDDISASYILELVINGPFQGHFCLERKAIRASSVKHSRMLFDIRSVVPLGRDVDLAISG